MENTTSSQETSDNFNFLTLKTEDFSLGQSEFSVLIDESIILNYITEDMLVNEYKDLSECLGEPVPTLEDSFWYKSSTNTLAILVGLVDDLNFYLFIEIPDGHIKTSHEAVLFIKFLGGIIIVEGEEEELFLSYKHVPDVYPKEEEDGTINFITYIPSKEGEQKPQDVKVRLHKI